MKLFGPLYDRALVWSRHPKAPLHLTLLSFIEAIIFPVAPEVMLAPMCLAQPKHAFRFASLSLLGSILGALVGYALGHYAWEAVRPLLSAHLQEGIGAWVDNLKLQMHEHPMALYGTLLVAAIQPVIPMKIVTWASGIVGVPLGPFLACMLVGRGKRVYLIAAAIRWGGEKAEAALRKHIEWIGWVAMVLLAVALGWLYLRHRG
jgi:membrane protein YqaA with SNARE-associated domain